MDNNRLLVLTDFSTHSSANSMYSIVNALRTHKVFSSIHIASRGLKENDLFFHGMDMSSLTATRLDDDEEFGYPQHESEGPFGLQKLEDFDYILLRLPRPIYDGFFEALVKVFDESHIMNNPLGITKTGSKKYLLNFPELTPAIKLCEHLEDIKIFIKEHNCVLKPLENYGGKGLVRIMDGKVDYEGEDMSFDAFANIYEQQPIHYLAMEYLEKVSEGDKRIVVVNGEILATSLRLPAEGNWLCNISQGGSARVDVPTEHEYEIVKKISPILIKEGIMIYGLDTLMGNHGKRVISEINTLSSGGIHETIKDSKGAAAKRFAALVKGYIEKI